MLPEVKERINPAIIRAISEADAFYCRGEGAAALVFALRGWERVPGNDPYLQKHLNKDATYFSKGATRWTAAHLHTLSNHGLLVLDVRALMCAPQSPHFVRLEDIA